MKKTAPTAVRLNVYQIATDKILAALGTRHPVGEAVDGTTYTGGSFPRTSAPAGSIAVLTFSALVQPL